MKTYTKIDEKGLPLGFWNEDVYPPEIKIDPETGKEISRKVNPSIPKDAIEITTKQWRAFIENPGLRKWEDGHVVPHEPEGPSEEEAWDSLRIERDRRLAQTDWVILKSIESGSEIDQKWIDYRQDLRDLTDNTTDPKKINWPKQPE